MKIGTFKINTGRTLVVAEIGVNHDGSAGRALALVDAAKSAGADAVKLQVFRAATLMHPSCQFAAYQQGRAQQADPIAMLRAFELDDSDLRVIADHARSVGLGVVATPFSPSDVARVVAIGSDAIKIASPDLINVPLLRAAMASALPLIVSTGASEMGEIEGAVQLLAGGRAAVCLLHCISAYPTHDGDARLAWIGQMRGAFGLPVGYSDHTCHPLAGALAVAAGACVVEKHLTYDRDAPGPDHWASLDAAQFAEYVAAIRVAEAMRGGGTRSVLPCERDVRDVSRQSLVTRVALRAGDAITAAALTTQRPGTGIPASAVDDVAGLHAARDLPAGTLLLPDMIVGWRVAA
jgi:sialic acid synthase SpsE